MRCFAQGPRFEEDFFIKCHDISRQVEDTHHVSAALLCSTQGAGWQDISSCLCACRLDFLTLYFRKKDRVDWKSVLVRK
jgi:hypothetical protein